VIVLALILTALAVARLAQLVANDDITVGFRRWVVERFGKDAFVTRAIHCAPWCMSLWFALMMPAAVLWPTTWLMAFFSVPAGSMVAAMILSYTDRE